jgi:hypothetical protein
LGYLDNPGPVPLSQLTDGQFRPSTLSIHLQGTLTVTPHVHLQYTTLYTPHNPIGTYSHPRMKKPSTHLNPTTGQIPIEGNLSSNMQIVTGGEPPLIGHTPVATQPMAEGKYQPSFTRNPPQSWGPPQGGHFHQLH